MKNRRFSLLICTLVTLVAFTSCTPKEDYTEIKKDIQVLKDNWKPAGDDLRATMSEFKDQMAKYRKSQQELTKITEFKNATLKKEAQTLLTNATGELDSLKMQMDSLNAYSKKWSEKSKELNVLIKNIQEEQIKVADGTKKIAELRAFKAQADPKLSAIRTNLEAYKPRHQKVTDFVAKLKKKKS